MMAAIRIPDGNKKGGHLTAFLPAAEFPLQREWRG
jgi:hypothetical protein